MSRANELLKELAYFQNGPPLPTYEPDYSATMEAVWDYLESIEKAAEQRGYSGGWQHEDAVKEHAFSLELAYHIWQISKDVACTVYDIGAGPGFYAQYLFRRGLNVQAFDAVMNRDLELYHIQHMDISSPVDWIGRADVVLCLEVGEHIDQIHEQQVLNNLCRLARNKIIMSWAVPGQGGFGHVNCQPNDYIIHHIEARGWAYNEQESTLLRGHCSGCSWFENTLMVFDKKD